MKIRIETERDCYIFTRKLLFLFNILKAIMDEISPHINLILPFCNKTMALSVIFVNNNFFYFLPNIE